MNTTKVKSAFRDYFPSLLPGSILFTIIVLLAQTGCATPAFKGVITGNADPRDIKEAHERAEDVDSDTDAKNVRVYYLFRKKGAAKLPSDIRMMGSGKDARLTWDTKRHKMITTAHDKMDYSVFFDRFGWRFYPYNESWRKVLCYPQVPLNWVTIYMWSFFSPTYWTCRIFPGLRRGDFTNEFIKNEKAIVRGLKKLAHSLDGDTVLIDKAPALEQGVITNRMFVPIVKAYILDDLTRPNRKSKYSKRIVFEEIKPASEKKEAAEKKPGKSFNKTVILKNGVRISGVSVSITKDSVVIIYPNGESAVLKKKEVASIKQKN